MGWKHRISNIDKDNNADCAACGRVKVKFKKHKKLWVCFNHLHELNKKRIRKPGYWKKQHRRGIRFEWRRLMESSCEICGSDKRLVPDHNHTTNEYRGTLCSNCNCGIGFLNDNVNKIEKALQYLKR